MSVENILKTHPRPPIADLAVLVRCIEECGECQATCTICADASTAEDDVRTMLRVISLCLDCADNCDATRRIVSRQTAPDLTVKRTAVEACLVACLACAEECERHAAEHEHCRLSAEECRRCAGVCQDLLAAFSA
jgi:hypothetical protein